MQNYCICTVLGHVDFVKTSVKMMMMLGFRASLFFSGAPAAVCNPEQAAVAAKMGKIVFIVLISCSLSFS